MIRKLDFIQGIMPLFWKIKKRYRLLQFSNIRVYRVFNISSIIGQLCLKTDKNVRLMIYLYYMTENERKT